jgi:2-polyprenyl-6-methoxyphenol hydroxylase-like FAD-dependent oxidoreductase
VASASRLTAPKLTSAVIGAGPAGLLFSFLGKILMADSWTVQLFDKRESYARTHRLRLAPEPYLAIQRELRDPRFDELMAFLGEHRFSPEINVLEAKLASLLAALGVMKTVREITSLDDLRVDTVVAADSVHSAVRELVRGGIEPRAYTHERIARLRVTGADLPAHLTVVDQFRLSKVLGSVVDYRRNSNGFAEVDLFLTDHEHAIVRSLGASPKAPVALTADVLRALDGTLLRAVVAQVAQGAREVALYSTFSLEHVVMPRVAFRSGGKRVFLVGDAAVSLPFFRGMASLGSCAYALARAHADGALDRYDGEVAEIVRREVAVVRSRAQLIRLLRELVRLSSLVPFPIQSWWLSAARDPVPDRLSPGAVFNLAIAANAVVFAALALFAPWAALLSLLIQAAGGFAYRWTLQLEPGPHKYVRRVWEVQIAIVLVTGAALAVAGRANLLAAFAWWILGAAFAIGMYAFEGLVGRRLARARVGE